MSIRGRHGDGPQGSLLGRIRWSPWLVMGLILGALVVLAVGVILGLLLFRNREPASEPTLISSPRSGEKYTAPQIPETPIATRPKSGAAGTTEQPPATETPTPLPPDSPTPEPTPLPDLTATTRALLSDLNYRAGNGQVVVSDRFVTPPQIDGTLAEWGVLPNDVPYDFYSETASGLAGNRTGAADLSGKFAVFWDTSYLYLGIEVTDDVHVQIKEGRDLYQGDDVEIQFDADLAGDFTDTTLSSDDGQIGLSAGNFEGLRAEAYVWRLNGSEAGTQGIVVASSRSGTVTTLEARIPWQALRLSGPVIEVPFGFALCLSDNDSPGTAQQQSVICTSPGRQWGDPTTWGTLVLVDWR